MSHPRLAGTPPDCSLAAPLKGRVKIAKGEAVEHELDAMIRRRDTQHRETEGERLERELWQEIAEREEAKDLTPA